MSDERDEGQDRGFTVRDRRGVESEEPQASGGAAESGAVPPGGPARSLPEIDFSTFVLSLITSAMVHLGEAPDPDSEQLGSKNLALAKQTIDIIGILKDKTKGNLTLDEETLIGEALYDLRLRYVTAAK